MTPRLVVTMLMVVAVGCTRGSSKSPPGGIARQAPSAPRPVAIAGDAGNVEAGAAGTGMAAASAHCRVEPDGGRLLADGSDLRDVRLVANGGRAMATWASNRPRSGNTELEAFAAILGSDGSVQETRSIAKDLFETGARPSSRSFLGAIPLVTAGGLALVTCEHLVISGAFQCSMVSVDGWRPTAKVPYRSHFFIGPRLSLGAAALGNGFVAFVGEHAALAVASSARKIPKSTKDGNGIEFPGAPISLLDVDGSSFPEGGLPIAPIEAVALGSDSALGVFRMGPSIRGRRVAVDEKERGPLIVFRSSPTEVGAPWPVRDGDQVEVYFAERPGGNEPFKLQRASLRGGTVSVARLDTPEQARAPSAVVIGGGQRLLAWVAGDGVATRTLVARLVGDKIQSESVLQLSHEGIESGDGKLATDDTSVFAAWLEYPKKGHVELFAARVACPTTDAGATGSVP